MVLGGGDVWFHFYWNRILVGNYRPSFDRRLPQCKDVDVEKLKQSWSATGLQQSATVGAAVAASGE
jgi:hypothetical protein